MFIPNLPIHLTTEKNKFEWNDEIHLKSILSSTLFDDKESEGANSELLIEKKIGTKLTNLISTELKILKENIVDLDLILYDTQPSRLLGINKEFVASGRLDNLGSTLTSIHSLIDSLIDSSVQTSINIVACFDDEEVGSLSYQGASGEFFAKALARIFRAIEKKEDEKENLEDAFDAFCARSFVLSCDMAHAYNPNYTEKYQNENRTHIHEGITLKVNTQLRYATDSEGAALVREVAKRADVPVQYFMVRQDSPCGTTIGPIITGKLGIKTVDIGITQFAMHSIRELCGVVDLLYYKRFFVEYFSSFEECIGNLVLK